MGQIFLSSPHEAADIITMIEASYFNKFQVVPADRSEAEAICEGVALTDASFELRHEAVKQLAKQLLAPVKRLARFDAHQSVAHLTFGSDEGIATCIAWTEYWSRVLCFDTDEFHDIDAVMSLASQFDLQVQCDRPAEIMLAAARNGDLPIYGCPPGHDAPHQLEPSSLCGLGFIGNRGTASRGALIRVMTAMEEASWRRRCREAEAALEELPPLIPAFVAISVDRADVIRIGQQARQVARPIVGLVSGQKIDWDNGDHQLVIETAIAKATKDGAPTPATVARAMVDLIGVKPTMRQKEIDRIEKALRRNAGRFNGLNNKAA